MPLPGVPGMCRLRRAGCQRPAKPSQALVVVVKKDRARRSRHPHQLLPSPISTGYKEAAPSASSSLAELPKRIASARSCAARCAGARLSPRAGTLWRRRAWIDVAAAGRRGVRPSRRGCAPTGRVVCSPREVSTRLLTAFSSEAADGRPRRRGRSAGATLPRARRRPTRPWSAKLAPPVTVALGMPASRRMRHPSSKACRTRRYRRHRAAHCSPNGRCCALRRRARAANQCRDGEGIANAAADRTAQWPQPRAAGGPMCALGDCGGSTTYRCAAPTACSPARRHHARVAAASADALVALSSGPEGGLPCATENDVCRFRRTGLVRAFARRNRRQPCWPGRSSADETAYCAGVGAASIIGFSRRMVAGTAGYRGARWRVSRPDRPGVRATWVSCWAGPGGIAGRPAETDAEHAGQRRPGRRQPGRLVPRSFQQNRAWAKRR